MLTNPLFPSAQLAEVYCRMVFSLCYPLGNRSFGDISELLKDTESSVPRGLP